MVVYLESSAALFWLFGEAGASQVVRAVEGASLVVTSELTGMECARAIHRARAAELVTAAQAASLLDDYRAAAGQWDHLPIRDRVTHLAAAPWPVEPVRTLDAIHLGSVLLARSREEQGDIDAVVAALSMNLELAGSIAAVLADRHVHGVGVAEQIVQIAKNFLIGAD